MISAYQAFVAYCDKNQIDYDLVPSIYPDDMPQGYPDDFQGLIRCDSLLSDQLENALNDEGFVIGGFDEWVTDGYSVAYRSNLFINQNNWICDDFTDGEVIGRDTIRGEMREQFIDFLIENNTNYINRMLSDDDLIHADFLVWEGQHTDQTAIATVKQLRDSDPSFDFIVSRGQWFEIWARPKQ